MGNSSKSTSAPSTSLPHPLQYSHLTSCCTFLLFSLLNIYFSVTGDDILETEWEVAIPAGDNGTTFQISVIADDLAEADETFELELTVLEEPYFAVSCATESTATVVIEDDGMCGLHRTYIRTVCMA